MMKLKFIIFALTFFWNSAARSDDVVSESDSARSVEEIINQTSKRSEYYKEKACIDTKRIRSTKVLDNRHVVFKLGREKYFLVQLANRCPGLRRNQTVKLNMRLNRLCEYDTIQGFDTNSYGSMMEGARCMIPGFTEVTEAQVEQLQLTLRDELDKARAAAKEKRRLEKEARRAKRQAKS